MRVRSPSVLDPATVLVDENVMGDDSGAPGTPDPPDTELAARAAAGDAAAFGTVFDRYAQDVYRFCWRHALTPAMGVDAEDLMSVVFLEAWAARSRLVVVDGTLRPWLLGVATNVVRNQRRSLRRHRAALRRLPAAADEAPNHADVVGDQVDEAARLHRVLAALGELSTKERQVIELCGFEGLSTEVVAGLLGVPEGTVRSRLARARARLGSLGRTGEPTDPTDLRGHEEDERASRAPVRGGATWTR